MVLVFWHKKFFKILTFFLFSYIFRCLCNRNTDKFWASVCVFVSCVCFSCCARRTGQSEVISLFTRHPQL